MKIFSVTVWASEKFKIEAESKEAAEEIAAETSAFPWVDYCESEEIET